VYTRKEASAALGISELSVDKLVACGLLHPQRIARLVLFDEQEVAQLASRPQASTTSQAIVVRMGKPREGGPRPLGWSTAWDEPTKIAAASRWWPIRELEDGGKGLPLLAVVSDWIVGHWRIEEGHRQDGASGDWAFELKADPELSRQYGGHRIALGRGPKVVKLPRSTT
jgi:hypothetical protein